MASNVFFQKGSLFRAVQFFEESGRNRGRVQQNLRLWVEKAELFGVERNADHLSKLKPVVGNVENREELFIGIWQAQLYQCLTLIPFPG